jgi:hypothetical protein
MQRELHSEEVYGLCCLPTAVRMIKSQAGDVVCIGRMEKEHKILVRETK